jgi:hypothetical protein
MQQLVEFYQNLPLVIEVAAHEKLKHTAKFYAILPP